MEQPTADSFSARAAVISTSGYSRFSARRLAATRWSPPLVKRGRGVAGALDLAASCRTTTTQKEMADPMDRARASAASTAPVRASPVVRQQRGKRRRSRQLQGRQRHRQLQQSQRHHHHQPHHSGGHMGGAFP
eukprot:4628839-Pyramimonas_sp.AAC.1